MEKSYYKTFCLWNALSDIWVCFFLSSKEKLNYLINNHFAEDIKFKNENDATDDFLKIIPDLCSEQGTVITINDTLFLRPKESTL